jgi:hypothetical protein
MKDKLIAFIAAVGLVAAACRATSQPENARPTELLQADPQECVDLTGSATARVTMTDNSFDPNCYTITSDQSLTFGTRVAHFTISPWSSERH